MATFTVQRAGFTRVPELFYSIVSDLIANGFAQKYPSSAIQAPVPGSKYSPFKVTLETTDKTDPLSGSQPWRIHFDCVTVASDQVGDVYIAAPIQLPNDGTVALLDKTDGSTNTTPMPAGMLNITAKMPTSMNATTNYSDVHFISRPDRITTDAHALSYPMSYRLTVTDHGVAVAVWEDATEDDLVPQFSWFLVQRPVNHLTGIPLTTGHCPMFCVYGMKSKIAKFVVRESDVLKPTVSVPADEDSEDSAAIINSKKQISITENNRYVMSFPNGLNTSRYMYTEELDMIACTSADVVSQYSEVPITAYGEATPRKYKALHANGQFGTGMRVLFLIEGGSRV